LSATSGQPTRPTSRTSAADVWPDRRSIYRTYKRGAPHCYGPAPKELLEAMTQHIERSAPPGADITSWRYK